jgi:hypothetical protein
MGAAGTALPEDTEDTMAPLSFGFFSTLERWDEIDVGVYDFVLRCIDGTYLDKYLHIKQTP